MRRAARPPFLRRERHGGVLRAARQLRSLCRGERASRYGYDDPRTAARRSASVGNPIYHASDVGTHDAHGRRPNAGTRHYRATYRCENHLQRIHRSGRRKHDGIAVRADRRCLCHDEAVRGGAGRQEFHHNELSGNRIVGITLGNTNVLSTGKLSGRRAVHHDPAAEVCRERSARCYFRADQSTTRGLATDIRRLSGRKQHIELRCAAQLGTDAQHHHQRQKRSRHTGAFVRCGDLGRASRSGFQYVIERVLLVQKRYE